MLSGLSPSGGSMQSLSLASSNCWWLSASLGLLKNLCLCGHVASSSVCLYQISLCFPLMRVHVITCGAHPDNLRSSPHVKTLNYISKLSFASKIMFMVPRDLTMDVLGTVFSATLWTENQPLCIGENRSTRAQLQSSWLGSMPCYSRLVSLLS